MTRSSKPDLDSVAKLYTDSLEKHSARAMGVGWRDQGSHLLRFDRLAEVIASPPGRETIGVLDLGCGYGALYEYLSGRGWQVAPFVGYDISEAMLEEARTRITAPKAEFVQSSTLDRMADYAFASGIFNVRLKTDEDTWRDYVLKTLDGLNSHANRGFAFNLLTSYVDWKEDHLFYGGPLFFFDHCKRRYSRRVSLLHDYPLWEWTIIVRKWRLLLV